MKTLLLLAGLAWAATVTVMVQETQVRKRPQFYAPSVGTAKLGDKYDAKGPKDGWYETKTGFIHQSAVSTKAVKVGSGSGVGGGKASAEEITLAGKGFNAQVEKQYGDKHKDLDFGKVDAMEKRAASDRDLLEFLKKGALLPEEAGR